MCALRNSNTDVAHNYQKTTTSGRQRRGQRKLVGCAITRQGAESTGAVLRFMFDFIDGGSDDGDCAGRSKAFSRDEPNSHELPTKVYESMRTFFIESINSHLCFL